MKIFRDLGVLRSGMAVIVLALILASPFTTGGASVVGIALLTTIVSPALFVIFVFVLPLDLVMTMVFMADKDGPERARLRRVFIAESVLFIALCASWVPFVLRLLDTRA